MAKPFFFFEIKVKTVIKVGIVGSRRRNGPQDKELLRQALNVLLKKLKEGQSISLVSGGCPMGADRFAEELALDMRLFINIHYPNKQAMPNASRYEDFVIMYHARNTLIARECDMLIALVAEDRKGGTEDTIKKAKALNKPIVIL